MALDDVIGLPEVIYTSEGEKYLHLPGLIVTENLTGEVRYLLTDGLGSVRHATDEAGAVVYEQSYDPYGNPLYASSDAYGYTGEWWVEEIGLLHLRARWYDPSSGTFLSKDPFEGSAFVPQSMNGFNYVHGNPVNWVDPSGKSPLVLCPILIVADGLLPVGDTVCAVLLVTSVGGTAVSGAILIKHVLSTPGVEWNLPIECSISVPNILSASNTDDWKKKPAEDILPGSFKKEFPGEYLGNSHEEIDKMLKNAKGRTKKRLQKAKKLLEQQARLMGKLKGKGK